MNRQVSFSELEYAAKKKQTRRDRFLAEIDAVTPWVELERTLTPFYPRSGVHLLDTSELTLDEVVQTIVTMAEEAHA